MVETDLAPGPLLLPDEPAPLAAENPEGGSPILFICEHGGRRFPKRLQWLGLRPEDRERHFVWDIGALSLARRLSRVFDAPLLHQRYSRLVCDCNRRPDVSSYIPDQGEGIAVPGNANLAEGERERRTAEIWRPFHDGVASFLDRRCAEGRTAAVISIHSFTPTFHAVARPWFAGVLYDRDPLLSPTLFQRLQLRLGDMVGRNEPYSMSRESDYTIPVHGEDRGLPSAEIEVRNDQLAGESGLSRWCGLLATSISEACAAVGIEATPRSLKEDG